jgi:predicted  nucleic acid-binding Zn-ribbon protein
MGITEQINFLIQLQKLDTQILSLEKRAKDGPIKVKKLEDDFQKETATLKEMEDELKALLVKQKAKENDLAAKEELIKKDEGQLNAIKTNKEYTAMQQEINGHQADKSLLEDAIISILDEVEAKKGEITKEKDSVKAKEDVLKSEKEKVAAEIKEIEAELGTLRSDRTKEAGKVDKAMLAKYERILKGKDGLVMAHVASNACGGCHMNLPPQVINLVKKKSELIFCESCARILYIE